MPPDRQELLCWFNDPADPKKIKIKTFRCDYYSTNGGSIEIFAPEELQTLTAFKDWEVVIDTRGCTSGLGDGLQALAPSSV